MAGSQPVGSLGAQAWGSGEGGAAMRMRQPPPQKQARQGWVQPDYQESTETWRAADGTIRSRPAPVRAQSEAEQPRIDAQPGVVQEAEPQPQWTEPGPRQQVQQAAGASYATPGTSYRQPGGAAPAPVAQQQVPSPAPQDYDDPAAGATGPKGSSQPGPGETRYDEIGYAGVRPVSGGGAMDQAVVAVHRSLPADSYVEVTSLDTGRTILVLVTGTDPGADHPIDLSTGAARLLGANGDRVAVRIRSVNPPAMDKSALQAGRPAGERADAPQVLLTALRKRLPGTPSYAAAPPAYGPPRTVVSRPAPPRVAPPRATPAAVRGGFVVQVAALSSAGRAQALAQSMGGFVKPGGGLYRVQLGPFATQAQAQAARQRAAGAGYGDARVQAN